MENFLTQFTNEIKEVTQINSEINVSPEFHGHIDIAKGLLTMRIIFYARMYKMYNGNSDIIKLDDWEVNEVSDIKFNGIVVDDLSKLLKSMEDSGLSTLAKDLKVTDDEYKVQIAKAIEGCSLFKTIYSKKAFVIDKLSDSEQKKLRIEWLIKNYHNVALYQLSEFLIDGVKPTKEQLQKLL